MVAHSNDPESAASHVAVPDKCTLAFSDDTMLAPFLVTNSEVSNQDFSQSHSTSDQTRPQQTRNPPE